MEALKASPSMPLGRVFEEGVKRQHRTGKFADFVVLDENPLAVDPMHLKDIEIAATIVGDVLAYGASNGCLGRKDCHDELYQIYAPIGSGNHLFRINGAPLCAY